MDLDNHPTVLNVRKHLVEHLGPPAEVYELSGSALPGSPLATLNLAYFEPGGPQAPVVFATCGASLLQMKDGRRVEALAIFPRRPPPEQIPAVHRLLGAFALFPEANQESVQMGDVVRAREELAPLCQMDAVLFVPPLTFMPSFHRIGLSDTEVVDLVWLLPVYAVEAEYALRFGPQQLMLLFTAQQLDLTDPTRAPADTAMTPEEAAEHAQRFAEEIARRPPPTRSASAARAQPPGSRRSADDQSIQVQRRQPPSKPSAPPSARAARPRRGVTRPKPAEDEIRFDLQKDALPGTAKPARPARAAPPPEPKPEPKPEAPKLTKAERVAALKKAAKEARVRAKERAEGKAPPPPPAGRGHRNPPGASPAPGVRRPPPVRRAGTTETENDATRAASRRRGNPFRRGGSTPGDPE